MSAADPYRYFRVEAREIVDGLGAEILELEKGEPTAEPIGRLLRHAHTLKGAARVVGLPRVADLAHAMEEVLAPYREATTEVPKERIAELLQQLDKITAELASLGAEPGSAGAPSLPPSAQVHRGTIESFERVRVDVVEVDTLLEMASETAIQIERIAAGIEPLLKVENLLSVVAAGWASNGDRSPKKRPEPLPSAAGLQRDSVEELRWSLQRARHNLSKPVEAARREIVRVRESAERLRLVPANVLFASLQRAVRDPAATLAKRVEFVTVGGDERLEGRVLSMVGEALLHLVRNAVAHGIESPGGRLAAGKPASGIIRVRVERRGRRIAFICSDDGRGFDLDAVRRAVVGQGLVPPASAAALSSQELIDLLLERGLTTATSPGAVAGRGIGLTVVRHVSSELNAHIKVLTEVGRGSTVEIEAPLLLSSATAILVEAGGVPVWFPLEAVRCTVRLKRDDIVSIAGRESIVFEGSAIPFVTLAPLLHVATSQPGTPAVRSALIVQSGAELIAVGIDRVIRTADVIIHPLPSGLGSVELLSGASFDSEGNVQLVMDPAALRNAARLVRAAEAEDLRPRPHILVIDDSLTSRMLEQSILEGAGYKVDVSASAEEALSKAHQGAYNLFVCDIEMPGMDGFEFVKRARECDDLRGIPSIMVTSRSGEENRKHAVEVGARAYICKSEFDEQTLLSTIRELVG